MSEKDESGIEEEKVDVSKPVPKPDRGEFDTAKDALEEEIKQVNAQLKAVDEKINDAKSSGSQQNEPLRLARDSKKKM